MIDLNADGQNSTTVTLGATYDTETVDANARYEVNLGSNTTHVLTAGTTFAISQELYSSITVAYLNDSANEVRQGLKFSVAAAYRGDDLNLLTNQTARFGLYAEDEGTEISGDTRVSVPLDETWGISAGYIYQYLAGVGYQDLVSVGVTGNLWDSGSVTAYGRLFHDWTNQSFSAGLSLEASQQIGCGVYGVAGYNFFDGKGMSGAPFYARSGLYVRFDIAFDEEWQCGAGSVGDRVFVDANNNGVQDEQEAGVEIALYSDKGNLVARTFSDKNGAYAFNRVNPGDYYIKVAAPFKFAFSAYQQGENALLDSDISPETFSSHVFTITWNHHIIDLDIGLVPLEGENQP